VKITRDLYRFGVENGFLRYRSRTGDIAKIKVTWQDR
jgi:hypothetical protein